MFQRLLQVAESVTPEPTSGDYQLYSLAFDNTSGTKYSGKITVPKPEWAIGKQTVLMWTTNSISLRARAVCAPFVLSDMGQLAGNAASGSARRNYPLTAATSDSASVLADEDDNAWYFWFTSNSVNKFGVVTFYALVNTGDNEL